MQYRAKDKSGFTEIVTTDDCKKQLYLPEDADLTLLPHYIKTARKWVENHCNVALVTKEISVHHESFPIGKGKLMIPIMTESENIISLSYVDDMNAEQTIDIDDLIFCNIPNPNYILPKENWPYGKNITIEYEANAIHHKDDYKAPVLLLVGHQFLNREIIEEKFENSLKNILQPLRYNYHV